MSSADKQPSDTLKYLLESCGLDQAIWCPKFSSNNLTNVQDLSQILKDSRLYTTLISSASEIEIKKFKVLIRTCDLLVDTERTSDEGLESILEENDFEPSYWLPIFKEHLGVISEKGIKNIGSESYALLLPFAQNKFDKIILKLFLGLSENSFEMCRNTQIEKALERSKQIHQLVKILESLSIKEEKFSSIVNNIKCRICEYFQTASRISDEVCFNDLTANLNIQVGQMLDVSNLTPELTDSEVFEKASNGIALQGVLLVEEFSEKIQQRKPLLQAPKYIKLSHPRWYQFSESVNFSQKCHEVDFLKALQHLGISKTILSISDCIMDNANEKTYLSTVRYEVLPMASCYIDDDDIKLSTEAIDHLKIDEARLFSLDKGKAKNICSQFLRKFGSHLFKGYYHFGGVFICLSNSKEFNDIENHAIKDLHNKLNYLMINSFWLPTELEFQAEISKCNLNVEKKTMTAVKEMGGPSKFSSYFQWKNVLVANNKYWCLIDRGGINIPVWTVIKEKHREDFKDVDYLADMLAFAFESMNTYASDHTFSFHIPLTVKQSKNAGEWAQKICEWVTYVSSDSDRTETTHIMTHLRTLQSLKQNQIEELIDPTIWPNLFLSKPIILQYLKLVIVFYKHNEAVDDLLQQIITLIDIDVMKSGSFDLCYIADYLYPKINSQEPCKLKCRDVLNLHFVIQQVVEQMKMRTTKNAASKKYLITRYLEQLFEQYTNYLHKANQNYELLLLHTLLYPLGYNNKENLFYQLLDIDELEYLAKEFNEPIIVFFKECGNTYTDLKVQAYIFYLTFNAISSGQIIDLIPKAKIHVQYLREKLGTKINAKISCILDATDDWAMLKSHMFTEFKGNKIQTIKGRDLMEILEASPSSPPHENDKIQKLSLKAVRKPLYADRFNALLQTLNLKDKYPEKLTKDDALVIRSSVLKAVDGTDQLHLLPYLVLHKIMICDTKCRADLIINTNKLHQPEISTYKSGKADINTEEDVCSSSSSASSASDNSSSSSDNDCEDENNISPIDVILVLLYCSDNLLRQILLQKLSLCQLAIPCLLPDPFSGDIKYLLWSMQSITKAWKKSLEKASYEECRIVHYKGPIISFMRIGTIRKDFKSKSTILNNILSDSKQEIFFTWNSDGGSYKKLTTNGVVDLCWYLPSGHEKSDLYHDPITFLNLHGNASGYPLQLNFIENVSTMLFFVIGDKEELNHDIVAILKKLLVEGGVVLMFYSKKAKKHACHKLKNSASKLYFIMLKGKNDSELRKTIHHVIQQKLQSLPPKHKLLSLNDCAQYANELQFMIDENDPSCNYGKKLAKCIMTEIESYSDEETKSKLLPLQSQSMWHQWAKHDKERYRHTMKHNISIEDYNLLKDSEKLAIRTLQIEKSDSVSPAMGMFLSSMLSCDNNTKKYFLEWLKFLLDDYSRKIIPNIFIKHQEIRSKIFKHKEIALTNSITMKELKYQLKKYSEQLISASFGIEHFFREVSQIYEARMDPMQTGIPTHLKELLSRLPLMVANLISEGYPIELLDGEASHVPITWVSHVLNNLMLLYQGKKIFTISVLGIQSTGKSTLLNTMFGLQFNTSAGRCTKGVFFQLLTVDSELQEKIKCDLILIIDTEGLRAPELQLDGSQTHDNELATFVIGLADVTVINIKGEAPADLNDILQTAVHAFIRMKRMTIHPRCHFVHHNIDDVTASDKTKLGRQKFLENLDVITESAAKIELCDSHLNSFKDVITFNEEVDVHFFPNLLKGDLSNPSVNPEYSKKAQELSSLLLQQACNMQNSEPPIPLCTFAGFEVRIKHLWDAVLQENYIFSFKNSLEIVAYNELDIILNHWSWKFQCGILEWRYQAENKINSTNSSSELEIVCEHCLGNARLISSEICNSVKQEFQEFFKQNKYKSTIAQWEAHTEHKISKLGEQFDENASHICNNLKARQQEFLKIQDLLRNQQCKLQHQITELVKSSKRESIEFSDEQLTVLFEDNWNEWKKEFVSVQFFTVDDIYTTAEVQLKKVFPQQYYYIKQQLDNQSLKQRKPTHFVLDQAKHVSSQRGIFKNLKEKDFREANFKSIEFMKVIDHKLLAEDCQNFNSIMIFAPLNELQKSISQFHSNEKKKFVFTQVYISEIAVHVSIHIIDRCKILLRQYKQKHDPLIILEEQKPTFKKSFVNQYNQISSDITAAENFCQLLVKPIKMQILKEFPDMIVRYMKQKVTFHSKQAFKCKILKDLANNNKFEDYIYYIQDIEGSFKKWAGDYIDEHCDEVNAEQESKLTEFSTRKLNNICDTITDSAKVTSLKSNLTVLLREFHKNLNGVIELNPTKLTDITGIDTLTDCQLFLKEVIAGAITIKEDLLKVLQDPQSGFVTDLKNVSKHSVGLLANSLQGCTATCPFCNEQCEMSVPNHIEVDPKFHSVKIHRPICLATYRDQKSRKLVPDLCTKVVGSKLKFISKESKNKSVKFKKYQDIYPKWYIPYDIREVPKYWRWFVFNYNDQIASEYDAEPANVDPSWRWITINEAIDSLQETYNF